MEKREMPKTQVKQNGNIEVNKQKTKTNLQFLLSQNDILPLLKKINKERTKNTQEVSLDKYIKNNKVMIFLNIRKTLSK